MIEQRSPGNAVLYPDVYPWYVLMGFLDLIVTYAVVFHAGGSEVNHIAQRAIDLAGVWGLLALKVATMVVVIVVCEVVGRKREKLGRRLALLGVAISALPFFFALAQAL